MAKKTRATAKKTRATAKKTPAMELADIAFTGPELEVLQNIVTDWLRERIVTPPYSEEVTSVIRKLEIPADVALPEDFEAGPPPLIPNLG
jgi:hypothetical protein